MDNSNRYDDAILLPESSTPNPEGKKKSSSMWGLIWLAIAAFFYLTAVGQIMKAQNPSAMYIAGALTTPTILVIVGFYLLVKK